jgi:uncharacterized cysteine cluster protein YcgN (CxxCxxCC family)
MYMNFKHEIHKSFKELCTLCRLDQTTPESLCQRCAGLSGCFGGKHTAGPS